MHGHRGVEKLQKAVGQYQLQESHRYVFMSMQRLSYRAGRAVCYMRLGLYHCAPLGGQQS